MDAKVYRRCLGSSQGVSKRLSFSSLLFWPVLFATADSFIPCSCNLEKWRMFLSLRMWFGNVDRNRKNDFDSFCQSAM
jgi:hypothetical protein